LTARWTATCDTLFSTRRSHDPVEPPTISFFTFQKNKKKKELSHKFLAKLSGSIIVRVRSTTYGTMRQEDKVGSIGLKKNKPAVDFFNFFYDPNELWRYRLIFRKAQQSIHHSIGGINVFKQLLCAGWWWSTS
jgi:hypothetical protein